MGLIGWAVGKAYDSAKASYEDSHTRNSGVMSDPCVRCFFENTYIAWTSGIVGQSFYNEAASKGVDGLILNYSPTNYPIIDHYFRYFQPRPAEFLVGLGEPCFFMTNQRLFILEPRSRQYVPIEIAMISYYATEGSWTKRCTFGLHTGQTVVIDQLEKYPSEEFLQKLLFQRLWFWQRPGVPPVAPRF